MNSWGKKFDFTWIPEASRHFEKVLNDVDIQSEISSSTRSIFEVYPEKALKLQLIKEGFIKILTEANPGHKFGLTKRHFWKNIYKNIAKDELPFTTDG
jgi:hypothetical protein